MNPADHDGRVDSPFIEFAENVDVIDLTDTGSVPVVQVLPEPVSANKAVGDLPSILPGRLSGVAWLGWAASSVGVAVLLIGGHAIVSVMS